MELREGAVVADRFRLIRLLGKGGMGEVWHAQHTALDIPCAVKFIHDTAAANQEARARFEREAKAAAQLRSNNVVQMLDHGVFEGTPYIAMEYLVGEPLNVRLKRQERLDPHQTFWIVAQVGRALTKAHAAGIVHRDLKPENVFLVADDEEDEEYAKVLDFGVAKRTLGEGSADSSTRTGALLGTPSYMSPEQAQGIKAVDARADLWSLAVLAFRCLTGKLPFRSKALGDLLLRICTAPLPVPSELAPDLPEGFDGWWERAAERDPDQRFQTAKELVEALGVALGVTMPPSMSTPMPMSQSASALTAVQPQVVQDASEMATQITPPAVSGASSSAPLSAATPQPGYSSSAHQPVAASSGQVSSVPGSVGAGVAVPAAMGVATAGEAGASASVGGVFTSAEAAKPPKSRLLLLVGIGSMVVASAVTGLVLGGVFESTNASDTAAPAGPEPSAASAPKEVASASTAGSPAPSSAPSAAASVQAGSIDAGVAAAQQWPLPPPGAAPPPPTPTPTATPTAPVAPTAPATTTRPNLGF